MKKFGRWLKNEWYMTMTLLRCIPATLLTAFVLSIVLMNLLANRSIDLQLSWLALDSGLVVSWITFLALDIIVKHFGPKAANRLTVVSIIFNLLISGLFMVVTLIPGLWGESFVEHGELINVALDNTISSTWYIIVGSTTAFLCGSIVNNTCNWGLGKLFKDNDSFTAYAVRSYASTALAQFVDNFIFAIIVSLNFFGWSILQCITCAITGAFVELFCEIIFSPIGYKVSKRWKKHNVGQEYIELNNAQR